MEEKIKLEVKMYSPQAFYTIKGVKFETSITGNHTGDILSLKRSRRYNDPIYRIIQNIPFGQRALHDIRLKFEVKEIYSLLTSQFKKK
jgi:hypothetical protein